MTWVWQNQKRIIHTLYPDVLVVCNHISKTFADKGIRLWQVLISAITNSSVVSRKAFSEESPPSLVWASTLPPARATAGSRRSQVAACRGKQLQMDVKGHLSISQLTSEISRHSSRRRKGTRVRGNSLFSHCLPPTFYTDNDKFVPFTFPLQWTKKKLNYRPRRKYRHKSRTWHLFFITVG